MARLGTPDTITAEIKTRAIKASRKFDQMCAYEFTPFVRVISRDRNMMVRPSSRAATNGKIIFLPVPMELGDDVRHDLPLCDQRSDDGLMMCALCAILDEVRVNAVHECAHIVYDSFAAVSESEKRVAMQKVVGERLKGHPDELKLREILRKVVASSSNMAQLCNGIDNWLLHVWNSLEDVYVNAALFDDRPGERDPFRASDIRIFSQGLVKPDGSRAEYADGDRNLQASIALYLIGSGMADLVDFMAPDVRDAVMGSKVIEDVLAHLLTRGRVTDRVDAAITVLEELRSLGFMEPNEYKVLPPQPRQEPQQQQPGAQTLAYEDKPEPGDGDEGDDADQDGQDDGDQDGQDGATGDDSDDGQASQPGDDSGAAAGATGANPDDDASAPDESASQGQGDASDDDEDGDERGHSGQATQSSDPSEIADQFSKFQQHPTEGHSSGSGRENANDKVGSVDDDEDDEEREFNEDQEQQAQERFNQMIEQILQQMDMFDEVSPGLQGVMINNRHDNDSWAKKNVPVIPEKDLAPALSKMRVAFTVNKAYAMEGRRSSGPMLDTPYVGQRLATGDFKHLHAKRIRPVKRDYCVITTADFSESTSYYTRGNTPRLDVIKMGMHGAAELFHRLGIYFEMYGHSGSGYQLRLETIKGDRQSWDDRAKKALHSLRPWGGCWDGHTMEYMRKRAEAHPATDKIILYFSDGDMPACDPENELRIMHREIELCQRKGIHLICVGVCTDQPKAKFGLDTIRYDDLSMLPALAEGLRQRLV
jgi:hypothetical protein